MPTPTPSALVIGEPECPPEYPRLLGARDEALAVCRLPDGARRAGRGAGDGAHQRRPVEAGATARTVINALFEKPWRIVHIAGSRELGE